MDIDDMVRSTDVTVHIIVLALLIAFASLLWSLTALKWRRAQETLTEEIIRRFAIAAR